MTDTSLLTRLNAELSVALRARDQHTLDTLRMLKAALTNKRVELKREPTEPEALQVVTTLVKQRKDSAFQFANAGRQELADKEQREAELLQHYLPAAVDDNALGALIDEAISDSAASGPKDMGKVMKALMPKLAGQVVDGKAVNELVRSRLAGS